MTRSLNLPIDAHLWQTQIATTVVFTQSGANPTMQRQLRERGVDVVEVDGLTPTHVLQQLYDRGCMAVLWECGGALAAQAIAEGAVQKIWAFVAPKIIGGAQAPSPIGELGLTNMTEALPLNQVQLHSIGHDILIEGYLPTHGYRASG
jgi:diaminohydroxyphosphoribosylaminopyrimidine deaminase/5-amino-6-(5-phosphoribosylamino)uracil reductase